MTDTKEVLNILPTSQANPLSFLDAVILNLMQSTKPEEMNALLSEFLSEESVYFMAEHKDMFFVLSEVWNETARNLILSDDDVMFPDGLLGLPPLFHAMGWVQDTPAWDPYHDKFVSNFESDPSLVNAAILLYIEGARGDQTIALDNFRKRIKAVEIHTAEEINFDDTLDYFGWSVETIEPYSEVEAEVEAEAQA
ncbi:MAG: hypothetical protein OEZ47_00585 [Gammaproteobacteria bacterium]|nr:hypothetical protein [Gammaproteobacteria bacterium]